MKPNFRARQFQSFGCLPGYCALFLLFNQPPTSAGADGIPGLAIDEVRVCQEVKDHEPVNILEHPDQEVKNRPVWVWLRLAGTSESLTHLTFGKELPLKTVWIYLGTSVVQLDPEKNDLESPFTIEALLAKYHSQPAKTLTLGTIKQKTKLKSETEESKEHRWTWRTASEKINLWPGHYRIFFYLTGGGQLNPPGDKPYIELVYAP
jgi:hypothetical protein